MRQKDGVTEEGREKYFVAGNWRRTRTRTRTGGKRWGQKDGNANATLIGR